MKTAWDDGRPGAERGVRLEAGEVVVWTGGTGNRFGDSGGASCSFASFLGGDQWDNVVAHVGLEALKEILATVVGLDRRAPIGPLLARREQLFVEHLDRLDALHRLLFDRAVGHEEAPATPTPPTPPPLPARKIATRREIEGLRSSLERSAATLPMGELERLAALDDLEAEVWGDVSDNPMFDSFGVVGTEPLDTSEIRRLAAAEIARRGSKK